MTGLKDPTRAFSTLRHSGEKRPPGGKSRSYALHRTPKLVGCNHHSSQEVGIWWWLHRVKISKGELRVGVKSQPRQGGHGREWSRSGSILENMNQTRPNINMIMTNFPFSGSLVKKIDDQYSENKM